MAESPLLGYNTNVRHHGKLYHIQTEDSGISHGHIFTHLFADGGRIIASKKTTYGHYLERGGKRADIVKKLMRESHKAMFIALRDGLFDEDEAEGALAFAAMEISLESDDSVGQPTPIALSSPELDVEALERAAEAHLADAPAAVTPSGGLPAGVGGRYSTPRPAATRPASGRPPAGGSAGRASPPSSPPSGSIFGSDLLSEKSLDEVILSYLAEDIGEEV